MLLLAPWLSAEERREALADLEELGEMRSRHRGKLIAGVYFWWQLFKYPMGLMGQDLSRERGSRGVRSDIIGRGNGMEGLLQDLRYAHRTLLKSPSFTAITVAILASCISVNTAIFSISKRVLMDPLPYPQQERVVSAWLYDIPSASQARLTPGHFSELRGLTDVFDHVAAFWAVTSTLTEDGNPEFLQGTRVTSSYFEVLGVRPQIGRDFRPEDDVRGGPAIVIISHELWAGRFGEDPEVVGRNILLDGRSFEVVGVMPQGLYPTVATISGEIPFSPMTQDFWVPLRLSEQFYTNRRSHLLGVVGRLAPQVSLERARAAVGTLGAVLAAEDPSGRGEGLRLNAIRDDVVGSARVGLWMLGVMVGFLLLIAAANVAALLMERAERRRTEMAVRVALGAGRLRLVRQYMGESLVLAALGGGLGVLLSVVVLDAIKLLVPFQIPRLQSASIDADTLVFTGILSVVTALAAGAVPALRGAFGQGTVALSNGAQGAGGARARRRVHGVLVASQTGFAVLLVIGAALMARSFWALTSVDPGFSPAGVMTIPVTLPDGRYGDEWAFHERLRDELEAVPGVLAATVAYDNPLQRSWTDGFLIQGRVMSDQDDRPSASLRPIGPTYFATLGIELLAGRSFTGADIPGARGVVIVNETLARRYFGEASPIGEILEIPSAQRILGLEEAGIFEIVGVANDVRFLGLDQNPDPALYLPLAQFPAGGRNLLIRGEREDLSLLPSLRQVIWGLDGDIPIRDVATLDDMLFDLVAPSRFNMIMLVAFAGLGLVLAGLGVYGLVSAVVVSRFKEIGLRMALGATRGSVLQTVMRDAVWPALLGGGVGLVAAAVLSRYLRTLLFGVRPTDPTALLAAPLILLAVALVASYLPARRAAAIDPAYTLRED